MHPKEILNAKVIVTDIPSVYDNNVTHRERYEGAPIQPINTAILVLISYNLSAIKLSGNSDLSKDPARFIWNTAKIVAKGEFVNNLNLGDNPYIIDAVKGSGTVINAVNNDYSEDNIRGMVPTRKAELEMFMQTTPSLEVFQYVMYDSSQVSATYEDGSIASMIKLTGIVKAPVPSISLH